MRSNYLKCLYTSHNAPPARGPKSITAVKAKASVLAAPSPSPASSTALTCRDRGRVARPEGTRSGLRQTAGTAARSRQLAGVAGKNGGTAWRLQQEGHLPSPNGEPLTAERGRSGSLAVSSLKVGSVRCDGVCAALSQRGLVPVVVLQGQDA
jgi:hypothetical protein